MRQRITETLVKGLAAPFRRPSEITYDTDLKGFGARVTRTGAKAFILNYRAHGRERRITIGRHPAWSAAAARKRAEELKREIDLGRDPLLKREAERSAPTFAQLCSAYEERHLPRKAQTSQEDDRRIIRKVLLPRFGSWKADAVRFAHVDAVHRELSRRTPSWANRVVALISRMYNLGIGWDLAAANPGAGIQRNAEQARQRYLGRDELGRLHAALDAHPDQSIANAVRLLLLTGARRGEVLRARWEQFDLDNAYWAKPAGTVKQRRHHRVPVSRPTVDLLCQMRASAEGPFLFPGRRPGMPLTSIKKGWAAIRETARVPDVRLHDLRHTFASHLASQGGSLPIIGALLGHTQAQTTQRYAHLLDDPLRQATERASEVVGRPKIDRSERSQDTC